MAAILRAATEIVSEQGMAALSQEAVARRAGITQSALRHHFATKEALIEALFRGGFASYRARATEALLDPAAGPETKLRRLIDIHLDHIERASDAYAFETLAHATRAPAARAERDEWYVWLAGQYAALIRQISPGLAAAEAEARAFQILTLVVGSWITYGRSHPPLLDGMDARRAALQAAVSRLTGA